MSVIRAHGHERTKVSSSITATEPITLEQYRHLRYIANEGVCIDCMEGDHETCRREGGYVDDEDNRPRCACHLTGHALDNR